MSAVDEPIPPGQATRGASHLQLDEAVSANLRALLPSIAEATLAGVTAEVPDYVGALDGQMGQNIDAAVQMALGSFLRLASHDDETDPGTPLAPAVEAAYALGRGEARSGRSMDALLAAYRVGARISWREMARAAGDVGVDATTMAKFAELVFAYIDELSAASVAGHADELSTSGRVRDRYLELLSQRLLARADESVLMSSADRAGWPVPRTLTAVLMPAAHVRGCLSFLGPETLLLQEELPELDDAETLAVLLVADMDGADRRRLFEIVADRPAVIGPARPWQEVRSSYDRAVSTRQLFASSSAPRGPVDTEQCLVDLVVNADREALEDLRTRALAPLQDLRPATAERLEETLRSWLLHQGRRDDVAADLFVHAQTVRYRMDQLRGLFGVRLLDPRSVLELTIALNTGVGPRAEGEND